WTATTDLAGNYFTGKNAVAAYRALGGVPAAVTDPRPGQSSLGVPLDIGAPGHWAPSPDDPQAANQAAVGLVPRRDDPVTGNLVDVRAGMQETIKTEFTGLDFAALKDIGWSLGTSAMLVSGIPQRLPLVGGTALLISGNDPLMSLTPGGPTLSHPSGA